MRTTIPLKVDSSVPGLNKTLISADADRNIVIDYVEISVDTNGKVLIHLGDDPSKTFSGGFLEFNKRCQVSYQGDAKPVVPSGTALKYDHETADNVCIVILYHFE